MVSPPKLEPPNPLLRDLPKLDVLERLELEDELLRLLMRWRMWCCSRSSAADWPLCTADCTSAARLRRLGMTSLLMESYGL